jgi:hypothetical protein
LPRKGKVAFLASPVHHAHLLAFSCVLLQQSKFCQVFATKFCEVFITTENETDTVGRAHEGRSAADCRARSRSARDQPYPADVCSSLSPFTFVLTRAHLPAFHSHFLSAHNTGTVFLKFCLRITFSSVFLGAHDRGTGFLKFFL